MPSTNGDAQPAPETRRDLRDRWWFRVAILVAALALAMLYVRGCGANARQISSERAVELARKEVSFTPDRMQVRLVQQGVPARSYWGVSFVDDDEDGRPKRVEVYLVDAKTGDVTRTS